ncbi:MAG: N-6 DNA methylase [Bacteroidaceae bacterium]|nr:N-6 DNA methylase [Bacteroidaceae bacterium]
MANDFEKIFEKLCRQHDPNVIFNEFLDYCIDINLFTTVNQNLDFKGREEYYFKMFQEWIKITNEALNNNKNHSASNGWYDYLGIFYENTVQSKYKAGARGQFFTPHNVCQCMTELTMFQEKDYTNKLVNDCCCGSGRFLLAAHTLHPEAIMIAADLDEVACKMAVLNFYIHGVRGSVINQNSLTLESFKAWRVNNYFGPNGLPLPHIELVSEREAYNFIGVKTNETKPIELNKTKETVQTKLW